MLYSTCHGLRFTVHVLQHVRARMVFRVSDDLDAAAEGSYHIAFGHRVFGVVGAFRVDVGAEGEQEFGDGRLVEDRDVVHGAQGGDDLGALSFGDEGAPLAFEAPHLLVRVDADDEQVAQTLRRLKVADVPDVQQVEAAVGEDDARAPPARDGDPRDQPVALKYARRGGHFGLFVCLSHYS